MKHIIIATALALLAMSTAQAQDATYYKEKRACEKRGMVFNDAFGCITKREDRENQRHYRLAQRIKNKKDCLRAGYEWGGDSCYFPD